MNTNISWRLNHSSLLSAAENTRTRMRMFAIGAMPDWIPADIRRASLRGQIHTELSPQELERVAATEGISVEELKKRADFDPYFNLRSFSLKKTGN